ncbi:hypothetical protein M5689_014878 [Euphorbia peplus]|nr:hypothetical protein M5689_014878 [Euphorbia peplus]
MVPKYEISYSMLWTDSADDNGDDIDVVQSDDKVEIEVEFEGFLKFLNSDPLSISRVKKSYLQPRIFLSLNGIRQCIIRNALVSTLEKYVGDIEYDLHTQYLVDDITPQVSSFACDFLDDPSNLNVRGLILAIKIMRTDAIDDELREGEIEYFN